MEMHDDPSQHTPTPLRDWERALLQHYGIEDDEMETMSLARRRQELEWAFRDCLGPFAPLPPPLSEGDQKGEDEKQSLIDLVRESSAREEALKTRNRGLLLTSLMLGGVLASLAIGSVSSWIGKTYTSIDACSVVESSYSEMRRLESKDKKLQDVLKALKAALSDCPDDELGPDR